MLETCPVIWDAHSGFEAWPHTDLSQLRLWREAKVDFVSVNVGYDLQTSQDTINALAAFRRFFNAASDFELVSTGAQFAHAQQRGKTAVAFDLEGVNVLNRSLDLLHLYHELGVRQIALAYNRNSDAGGGCHDDDDGLTPFGIELIEAMNNLGILVDCSHCGFRTTLETIQASTSPVIFSHSNPRALCDHERNIFDEQAIACAERGGVVGINGIDLFLGDKDCTTQALADHAQYWIKLLGAEHVGIGLDYFFETENKDDFNDVLEANAHYWPPEQYPNGSVRCAKPEQLQALAHELRARDIPQATVNLVLGQNFLRLATQVWR